jgi:hypothetical protein
LRVSTIMRVPFVRESENHHSGPTRAAAVPLAPAAIRYAKQLKAEQLLVMPDLIGHLSTRE